MSSYDKKISVVVPVYNAEKTVAELLNRLKSTLSCFKDYIIILVNDNSKDDSFKLIRTFAENDKHIIAIDLCENVGQQKATFLGLKYAQGDYTVIIDDDLAQNPEDILHLYKEIELGYDVVYGIKRNDSKKSPIRNFGSYIRDKVFNALTQKPRNIKVCSFRILSEETRKKVITANTEFIYISMEILKHTTNISNVFVDYTAGGPSNYSMKKLVALILKMYMYYSEQRFFKTKPLNENTYKFKKIINGEIM